VNGCIAACLVKTTGEQALAQTRASSSALLLCPAAAAVVSRCVLQKSAVSRLGVSDRRIASDKKCTAAAAAVAVSRCVPQKSAVSRLGVSDIRDHQEQLQDDPTAQLSKVRQAAAAAAALSCWVAAAAVLRCQQPLYHVVAAADASRLFGGCCL
jgi:hypothetical protein